MSQASMSGRAPATGETLVPESAATRAWIGFTTTVRKEVVRIVRIWSQTLLPPVITTTLYFIIFGPVLGARIGNMGGYSYLQYVTPGLIMMAVLTNAYTNVVSSFFGAKFQRHVEEMLVSPMPNWAILLGYSMGGVFRGLVIGVLVAVVSLLFAHLPVVHPLVTLTMAALTATAFSLAGFINGLAAKTFDDVAIFPTFVLTPLTMLGGVFYSVHLLPDVWRTVSLVNPILYMVNGFRYGILGVSDIPIGVAYSVLGAFVVGFWWIALVMLRRGAGLRP
ncbi:MAG: ABC transporter permease [Planctomycetota bacterium]